MSEVAMVGKPKRPVAAAPAPTAPSVAPQKPKTPMQMIQELMSPEHYSILLGILNWANQFQEMHNAQVTGEGGAKLSEEYFKVMLTPFTGFGANPILYQQMSHAVVPQLMSLILQWWSDEDYRNANTMPWLVMQAVAPTLANIDKGWDAASGIYKILAEMKKIDNV